MLGLIVLGGALSMMLIFAGLLGLLADKLAKHMETDLAGKKSHSGVQHSKNDERRVG